MGFSARLLDSGVAVSSDESAGGQIFTPMMLEQYSRLWGRSTAQVIMDCCSADGEGALAEYHSDTSILQTADSGTAAGIKASRPPAVVAIDNLDSVCATAAPQLDQVAAGNMADTISRAKVILRDTK